jgi:hypothetical protein
MILAALFFRRLSLQPMSHGRAPGRPMPGKLLYERRNGLSFAQFTRTTEGFVARHKLANLEAFGR